MAKIIKVASTTHTPQTANLFRTSRNSTTNPFKYSNFEGNTLQFADVFEGFEPKQTSKLKMIAASVAGSMNKIRTGFEPIINFVNRIGGGISNAWNYAKNTNVSDLPAIKSFNEFIKTPVCLPEIKALTLVKDKISASMDFLNTDITVIGKNVGDKFNTLISKLNKNKISSNMSVAELEALWKNEIALANGGAI